MIGRIYRIIHLESEVCYIGSTFNELRHRWQQHRSHYDAWERGNHSNVSIFSCFQEHGIDKFKIVLIKEYEVVDRAHLEMYEQLWINKFKQSCVNNKQAFSIEYISKLAYGEQKKTYYQANKEKLLECNRRLRKMKVDHYREYERNRPNIAERRKRDAEKFECECGGKYTRNHKQTHLRTTKHQDWLSQQ